MGLLKNKIAVITGGGRGIGKAIASQYSEQGAKVVIAEFDENSGKNTAEKIGGYFFKADISDEKGVCSLCGLSLISPYLTIIQKRGARGGFNPPLFWKYPPL